MSRLPKDPFWTRYTCSYKEMNLFLTFLFLFQIAKDGHLSEASDKALNAVVKDFMANYS